MWIYVLNGTICKYINTLKIGENSTFVPIFNLTCSKSSILAQIQSQIQKYRYL